MKTVGTLIAVAIVALALSGIIGGANWSEQATRRADIAAQAGIAIANRQAEATMHAADVQAQAAMHAADAATQRTAIIVAALPVTLLLIIVGGVLLMVVWYRGKAHLARMQAMLTGRQTALLAEPPPPVLLLAEQRNAQPALIDGQWHLLSNGRVIARCRQLQSPK